MKLEENQTSAEVQQPIQQTESNATIQEISQQDNSAPPVEPATPVITVAEDERYKPYFKMLKFVIKFNNKKLKVFQKYSFILGCFRRINQIKNEIGWC